LNKSYAQDRRTDRVQHVIYCYPKQVYFGRKAENQQLFAVATGAARCADCGDSGVQCMLFGRHLNVLCKGTGRFAHSSVRPNTFRP